MTICCPVVIYMLHSECLLINQRKRNVEGVFEKMRCVVLWWCDSFMFSTMINMCLFDLCVFTFVIFNVGCNCIVYFPYFKVVVSPSFLTTIHILSLPLIHNTCCEYFHIFDNENREFHIYFL